MKKISLIVTLVVIAGIVWYLESMKVHPTAGIGNGAPQAINLPSENSSTAVSPTANANTSSNAAAIESLSMIAAADKKAGYEPAIEIADPTGFVNVSSTFRLSDLIGKKVVLVDFWTYSCINCIRTLPYLTSWYEKYKDQGFVIVGVHTPEFDFEKDINNVQAAAKQYGIHYPIVLDSNYGTWQAYGNLYWPHEYLIDIAGYIVHDHIGEGSYDETEGIIQKLLQERATALGSATAVATSTVNVKPASLSGVASPETYFGAARNEFLANGSPSTPGTQVLEEPQSIDLNKLYLVGSWNFEDQYATNNESGAKIIYKYHSAKVFFVASGVPSGTIVKVMQDGKPVADVAGSDVVNGKMTITSSRLYNVIANHDPACKDDGSCSPVSGEHTLELIIDSPGLQAFTFTFG